MIVFVILSIVFFCTTLCETIYIIERVRRSKHRRIQRSYKLIVDNFECVLRFDEVEAQAVESAINQYVYLTGSDKLRLKKNF